MSDTAAVTNTDREIWRGPDEGTGSYYADSLHITNGGALGINCGGHVIVRPIREWHRMASVALSPVIIGAGFGCPGPACACCEKQPDPNCSVPGCAFKAASPQVAGASHQRVSEE